MRIIIQFCLVLLIPNISFADMGSISNEINRAINEISKLGNSDIRAGISNSRVTLTGVVSNLEMKTRLVSKVENIEGVSEVTEDIVIDPNYKIKIYEDEEIKIAVENALKTENISYLSLAVKSGVVLISADLSSFVEVDRMLAIIRGVSGVSDIKPSTKVKGEPYLSDVIKNY